MATSGGCGGRLTRGEKKKKRGPPAHPAEPALYWHHYLLRSGFPLLQSEVGWEIHLLVSALSNLYAKCKCGKEGKRITVINREQMEVKQVLTKQNPTLILKVCKANLF